MDLRKEKGKVDSMLRVIKTTRCPTNCGIITSKETKQKVTDETSMVEKHVNEKEEGIEPDLRV